MNTLTSFLDDFLVNVFHPQLDETLVELSTQTYLEADAFQQDPQWSKVARKPILKVRMSEVGHKLSLTCVGYLGLLRPHHGFLQDA